jgi:hypothetical protein
LINNNLNENSNVIPDLLKKKITKKKKLGIANNEFDDENLNTESPIKLNEAEQKQDESSDNISAINLHEIDQKQDESSNIESTKISNEVDQKQDENLNIDSTPKLKKDLVEDEGKFFLIFYLTKSLIFYFNIEVINLPETKNNVSNSSVISDEVDQKRDENINIESTTILNEVDSIQVENLEIESALTLNENLIDKNKGTIFKISNLLKNHYFLL